MTALRITTYILTSLASLVFLAMVVYGYLAVQDLRSSLQSSPLFGGSSSSVTPPGTGDAPSPAMCETTPDAPECALY